MGLKSIFDGLYVDQLIQKNDRGEAVMYPHGLAGRGYVLPPERIEAMRGKLRNLMLVSLATGLFGAIAFIPILTNGGHVPVLTWVGAVGVILAFAVVIYMQRHLADGLQANATARPSIGAFLRNARMARPLWSLWSEVVFGAIVIVPSSRDLFSAVHAADSIAIGQSVFMLLVGGLILWDGARGVMQRRNAASA